MKHLKQCIKLKVNVGCNHELHCIVCRYAVVAYHAGMHWCNMIEGKNEALKAMH